MTQPRTGRGAALPAVLVLTLTAAACGGGAESGSGSAEFPESDYPAAVYDGLSGKLTYYDTGGGAGIKALDETVNKDFTDLTGVSVVNDFNATMTKFTAAQEAGQGQWDVVEFATGADAMRAADAGYLEKLDTDVIPTDKLEEGSATDYFYGSHRYGIVLAWNTEKFDGDKAPTTMADLYDTERFPGKRCMFGYPEFGATLESALLAEGVEPEDMYPLDVERAQAKLDTINKDVVWWGSRDEAIQFLTSGECDLGVAWTGRLYDAVIKDKAPLDFTWDGAVYSSGWYGIPKNAPNKEAAMAYLAHFIQNQEAQVEFLERFPYPAPIRGLEVPESVDKWVPLGDNLENAFPEDDEWYSKNIGDLSERFTAWLSE